VAGHSGPLFRRVPGWALQVTGLAIGVMVWEVVGRLELSFMIPPFTAVLTALGDLLVTGTLLPALGGALQSFAMGLGISLLVGAALGVAMGWNVVAKAVLGPYLDLFMSLPTVAFVPLLFVWLGTGLPILVATVVMYALPTVAINVESAMRTASEEWVSMARSFGVGPRTMVYRVLVPAGLPLILAGLRVATSRALKGMVTGQVLVSASGLGALLTAYSRRFDAPRMYALIFFLIAMSLALTGLVRWAERRFLAWQTA
jgi:NitT/TauT family transport system permease protein